MTKWENSWRARGWGWAQWCEYHLGNSNSGSDERWNGSQVKIPNGVTEERQRWKPLRNWVKRIWVLTDGGLEDKRVEVDLESYGLGTDACPGIKSEFSGLVYLCPGVSLFLAVAYNKQPQGLCFVGTNIFHLAYEEGVVSYGGSKAPDGWISSI